MKYSPPSGACVSTVAGYVTISQQLLDQATLKVGFVNHRKVKSQRTRRRMYRAAPRSAAWLTHVKVPNRWPDDWRHRVSLFNWKGLYE